MSYPSGTIGWLDQHISNRDIRISAQIDRVERLKEQSLEGLAAKITLGIFEDAQARTFARRKRLLDMMPWD